MTFDLVLCEKPDCEGLIRSDAIDLIDMLTDTEFYPIELPAKYVASSAMGFISTKFAKELDYDYELLNQFIANILDDMDNENENCIYMFPDNNNPIGTIWLSR